MTRKGWEGEGVRHALARKGIKTGKKKLSHKIEDFVRTKVLIIPKPLGEKLAKYSVNMWTKRAKTAKTSEAKQEAQRNIIEVKAYAKSRKGKFWW